MKYVITLFLLITSLAFADDIYDIEQYLRIRGNSVAAITPDGSDIFYYDKITGVNQVYRIPADGGFPRQVTYFDEGIENIAIHPTRDLMLIMADVGGSERMKLYLADTYGNNIRKISLNDECKYWFGGFSRDGKWLLYRSNERNESYFDIYRYEIDSGESELIVQDDSYQYTPGFSPDGRYVIVVRMYSSVNDDILLYDIESGELSLVTPHTSNAGYSAGEWLADSSGFYFVSNEGRDFENLAFYDIASEKWEWAETPNWDLEDYFVTYNGKYLIYEINADAIDELVIKNLTTGEYIDPPNMPKGQFSTMFIPQDESKIVFTHNNTTNPTSIYEWDIGSDEVRRISYPFLSGIDESSFSPSELIHYESFDGLEIPAFVYLPDNLEPGEKAPVIAYAHGGPESQAQAWFSALFQYYLNNGYAVVIPNIRGSSGYGIEYAHADNIRKRLDSVKDMEYMAKWVGEQEWADSNRMAITGGSYGGYMVLACLTSQPDTWAAGVCSVGIANFVTFLENTGSWRLNLRESEYGYLDKDYDFLVEISPLTNADKIIAPLMVIHGANDPRVPVSEAEQIVAAVEANGVRVEFLLYEDEGHGISKLKNRLDAYSKQVKFLDEVLGE